MKESPLLRELEDIKGSVPVYERGVKTTSVQSNPAPSSGPTSKMSETYLSHKSRAVKYGLVGGILIVIGGVSNFNALEFLGIKESDVIDMAKGAFGEGGGLLASLIFLMLQISNLIGGFLILVGTGVIRKDKLFAGKILMDLGVGLGLIGFIILLFIFTTQTIQGAGIGIAVLTILGTLITLLSMAEIKNAKKEIAK